MLVVLISISTTCDTASSGSLDLDEITGKVENLKIKNNIGYHFKKKVRQVSQELFISRKIDTTMLIQGIEALKSLSEKLNAYCAGIPSRLLWLKESEGRGAKSGNDINKFIYLPLVKEVTFAEANARCHALGKQLPEIYDDYSMAALAMVMKENKLTVVHAGIAFDPATAMQRFISTGMPLYRGFSRMIVYYQGIRTEMKLLLDNSHANFLYAYNSTLCALNDSEAPGHKGKYGDSHFRDSEKQFNQFVAPVICEEKWKGVGFEEIDPRLDQKNANPQEFYINVVKADPTDPRTVDYPKGPTYIRTKKIGENTQLSLEEKAVQDIREVANMYEITCNSVVEHALDTYNSLQGKVNNLLALVDISYHIDQINKDKRRRRRKKRGSPSFLSKIIFRTGFKAIWSLFGFVQQIRQDIKIHELEKQIVKNQRETKNNSELIKGMSETLQNQSIEVSQLKILTASLERRIEALERDMKAIQDRLSLTETKLEISVKLQLISNLIIRTEQVLAEGYNTLENIIHCSVLGQTSPLVLPLSQIDFVQREVRKVSSADLDTDFSKMQSIVVSDPNDPRLLLVIVNAAAVSKSTTDLITMTSIPVYSGSKTVKPALSYQTIILNQWVGTYVVLTEQEETNCLLHRCYVHGMEKSVYDHSCGIPQYLDKNLESCAYEEIYDDNKIHLIPALPDGAFFSFKDPVDAQLFCTDNNIAGRRQKVSGVGTLQLPNGCTLSVTDQRGRNLKLKGPPLHNFVQGQELILIDKLPLSMMTESAGLANRSHTVLDQLLEQHLGKVQDGLSVTNVKLDQHKRALIVNLAIMLGTILIVVLAAYISYRLSARLRDRLKFVWQVIENIRTRMSDMVTAIPFGNTMVKLLPIPLKKLVQKATKKKSRNFDANNQPRVGKRQKLKALKRFDKLRRKHESNVRWESNPRIVYPERNMPEESNAYITVEASRFPQARPRTLYPTEDVLNEIKILNQEVEGRDREVRRHNFNSLRKIDGDIMSITARGSMDSEINHYDSNDGQN